MTPTQAAALIEVRDFTARGDYAGMFTGRTFRKSTAQALKRLGLLDSRFMDVADGDGFIREGCKPREGYFLTEAGHEAVQQLENDVASRALF